MSFFEDYVQDGICCEGCGILLDETAPGYIRRCPGCEDEDPQEEAESDERDS